MSANLPTKRVQAAAAKVLAATMHLGPQEAMHALLCVAAYLLLRADGEARDGLAQMMTEGIREGRSMARQHDLLMQAPAGHG